MHSPATRTTLEQCRCVVADADVSDELRVLARDLLDHLLQMHEENRMRVSVLLLALDSLELVPGLEDCVSKLRATASREQAKQNEQNLPMPLEPVERDLAPDG